MPAPAASAQLPSRCCACAGWQPRRMLQRLRWFRKAGLAGHNEGCLCALTAPGEVVRTGLEVAKTGLGWAEGFESAQHGQFSIGVKAASCSSLLPSAQHVQVCWGLQGSCLPVQDLASKGPREAGTRG